jgi:diguanylate cyclase (GGDEF)-like protein
MLGKLLQRKRSEDADPFRGAQHDVAVRVSGILWILGPSLTAAFTPFYPPTAQFGAFGWVLFWPLVLLSIGFGVLAATLRIRPGWNEIYATSLNGVAQIAFVQWQAGGGHAPYLQWLLLPTLAVATQQKAGRCLVVLAAAAIAAFSPLLYSTLDLPSTIAEVLLLSAMTLIISAVMTSVRSHRARLKDDGEYAASLARVDPLTGLPNRRSFEEVLSHTVELYRQQGRPLSLLLCDVNSFKDVNDRFGHPAGDKCLREIATALRGALRRPDAAFRWAGDEFAVILHDADELSARGAAARLQEAVRQSCVRPDGESITVGAGLSVLRPEMTPDQLVASADVALLEHKAARRRADTAPSAAASG